MNNSLYNLRDKWKQQDWSEVLWVSLEDFFIQGLNFGGFIFIWEKGKFDDFFKFTFFITQVNSLVILGH